MAWTETLAWQIELERLMGIGGDLKQQAMEELAGLLEDGKKIAFKTAVVNGMFTVSVRKEPGNPMADRCFTVDEEWLPDSINGQWFFHHTFFQKYSVRQAKIAEERTLRTLVANLSKNGVRIMWIQDQPDGKVLVKLTNGSNFRVDPKWRPTFCSDENAWVFPPTLFKEYGPKPGSVLTTSLFANVEEAKELFNKGRTPVPFPPGSPDAIVRKTDGTMELAEIKTKKDPVVEAVEKHFGDDPNFQWIQKPGDRDAVPIFPVDPNCPSDVVPNRAGSGPLKKYNENPPMTLAQLTKALGKSVDWGSFKEKPDAPKHGYHTSDIPKGKAGEFSKVEEEFLEAKDAFQNENPVMLLLEFADLIGAIERYLEVQHPSVKLDDVVKQAKLTNEVFRRGLRENRDPK